MQWNFDVFKLARRFRGTSQHHELLHRAQHLVVFCGCGRHVVDDGGDVAKDGGVQQRRDDHHDEAEYLSKLE